jgi:hypothetical protein
LVGLIINEWPEDGFLEAETSSHPQIVHIIKLFELCLTDSFITIIPEVKHFLHTLNTHQRTFHCVSEHTSSNCKVCI